MRGQMLRGLIGKPIRMVAVRSVTATVMAAGIVVGAGLVESSGAQAQAAHLTPNRSVAHGMKPVKCLDYTLFYDLTGTGFDYLNTSLRVCTDHTFTTGQASGGTWSKKHKKVTFTFQPQDAVYVGKKTPSGYNSAKKPGKVLLPAGGIWYAVKA
jgi:hypothetical protein